MPIKKQYLPGKTGRKCHAENECDTCMVPREEAIQEAFGRLHAQHPDWTLARLNLRARVEVLKQGDSK